MAYGDYILNQVKAARELKRLITGQDIEAYVVEYVQDHYPGSRFLLAEPAARTYDVELSANAKADLAAFVERSRLQRFTALHRPSSGAQRCRFENKVATPGARRIELLGQLHPLVRFVSAELRAKTERGERPFWPVVGVRVPAHSAGSVGRRQYAFIVLHWSIQALQAREQLQYAAVPLDDTLPLADEDAERLIVSAIAVGQEWLEAKNGIGVDLERAAEATVELFASQNDRYDEFVKRVTDENTDRVNVQIAALERHLDSQVKKLLDIRQRLLAAERRSLARATEGRIEKFKERVEIRRARIEIGREVKARQDLICVGVIEMI